MRLGAGAEKIGAPSPSEGNGVRPVSIGALGAGGAAVAGAAAGAAGSGAGAKASLLALRLPNTNYTILSGAGDQPARFLSFASSGDSRPPRARLASARPVRTCASWRNISAVLWP